MGNERSASLSVVGIFTCINPVTVYIDRLGKLVDGCRVALMADVAVHLSHLQGSHHTQLLTSVAMTAQA